jgi:hypothetical protein
MTNPQSYAIRGGIEGRERISLTQELYDFAADETTLAGLPRVVQVSARRSI